MKTILSVLTLAGSFACSGKTIVVSDDVGVPDEGGDREGEYGAASGAPGAAGNGAPGSTGCQTVAEIQRELEAQFGPSSVGGQHVGRWDGFIGEHVFPSDIVSLDIAADGTGTLVFGTKPPPPPPASADEGYLCDYDETLDMLSDACTLRGPHEGIRYELRAIQSRDDSWLQFAVRVREPWNAWCAMQTPNQFTLNPPCHFGVGPDARNYSFSEAGCTATAPDGSLIALDCDYLATLSSIPCTCAKDGCFYDPGGAMVDVVLFEEGRAMLGKIDGASILLRRVTDPSQVPNDSAEAAPEGSP